ncbi:hypothetical protein [Microbacterium rhizophilus]|uniref:hypothetical protein n=1 Tax=Microbacterium rhizophilus TaxID=3138934 RepID=UPI0031F0015A
MSSPFAPGRLDTSALAGAEDEFGHDRLVERTHDVPGWGERIRQLPRILGLFGLLYLPTFGVVGYILALSFGGWWLAVFALPFVAIVVWQLVAPGGRMVLAAPDARTRFAAANGLRFDAERQGERPPGALFDGPLGVRAVEVYSVDAPRHVEVGNAIVTAGGKGANAGEVFGYIAVRLRTSLPHIVLEPRVGNGVAFPDPLIGSQHLSLEGDFDRWYTLYCPAGAERDALYLFTPDVMARFVDGAEGHYVEIVGPWLLVYAPKRFSTLNPGRWEQVGSIVQAVTAKLDQWDGWRGVTSDDAAAADGVPASPRLRRSRDWSGLGCLLILGAVVAVVAFLVQGLG